MINERAGGGEKSPDLIFFPLPPRELANESQAARQDTQPKLQSSGSCRRQTACSWGALRDGVRSSASSAKPARSREPAFVSIADQRLFCTTAPSSLQEGLCLRTPHRAGRNGYGTWAGDDDTVATGLHGICWDGAVPKPPPSLRLIITPSPGGSQPCFSPFIIQPDTAQQKSIHSYKENAKANYFLKPPMGLTCLPATVSLVSSPKSQINPSSSSLQGHWLWCTGLLCGLSNSLI